MIERKKRGPKPKTAFYHARWSKLQISHETAAKALGVSVDQVKEWDVIGNDLATRYLLLWDSKVVRCEGWDGFTFSRGRLMYKGRVQWYPESLKADIQSRIDSSFYPSRIDVKTSFRDLM